MKKSKPIKIDIVSIFPNVFTEYFHEGMFRKAIEQNILKIEIHNPRDFTEDKWGKVDDIPYGGGAGMLMTPQPLFDTIKHIQKSNKGRVIYMSPQGKVLNNSKAKSFANALVKSKKSQQGIIIICGRYEGIDQRIIDLCVDEEISIGKYVLTGGELASMVFLDSIIRFIPGVLGDNESHEEESFSRRLKGKKEYPHYTRPPEFKGLKVPEVLMSGHHLNIKKWRTENLK